MEAKYFEKVITGWLCRHKGVCRIMILCLCLSAMCFDLNAQIIPSTSPEKDDTRKGNKQFAKEGYADAEADYKKALDKKNNMPEAVFNLGDAVYKQKRWPEATQQFELSSKTNPDGNVKAKALHNLGNTYMEQRKWEEAVSSYKNALRWNPNDRDTKYNLAYANAMLKQSNNDKKNNKNQDKKDKNKDKKDDKKDQQDQQKQQEQNPDHGDQQQQANQNQQKQGQKAQLSQQDAEKLLDAVARENQQTNDKVEKKKVKVVNVKILKDW